MNVLQVYDSLAVSSGISSVLMGWLDNIENEDDIHFDFLCAWKKEPSFEKSIKERGSNVFYIENEDYLTNYPVFIKNVKVFFAENEGKYDIVHLHGATFLFPVLYYAKKYGIKYRILHAHSAMLGNTKLSSVRNAILFQPVKKLANEYWACSEEAASAWFKKNGIKKCFIIKNGIAIEKYKRNNLVREQLRKEYGIEQSDFIIGHISNMTPIKNIPFLIEVFSIIHAMNQQTKLLLVGRDLLNPDIVELIKRRNIEDAVCNIGVRKDVERIIQVFDLGLMPSIKEGYGLVPIEMQAAGVPVVMSTGFPKIVCISASAVRVELDVEKWVDAIEIIMGNAGQGINPADGLLIQEYDISKITHDIIMRYIQLVKR